MVSPAPVTTSSCAAAPRITDSPVQNTRISAAAAAHSQTKVVSSDVQLAAVSRPRENGQAEKVAVARKTPVAATNHVNAAREVAQPVKVTAAKAVANVAAGVQSGILNPNNVEKQTEGSSGVRPSAPNSHEVAPKAAVAQRKQEVQNGQQAAKAVEKINAAQQSLKQQKAPSVPAKQALEDIVHVTPKNANSQTMPEQVIAVSLPKAKQTVAAEDSPKIATVRRAAERFERHTALMNSKSVSDLTFSSAIRGRSKSIGDALRTRFVEDQEPEKPAGPLPWAGRSPQTSRRKDGVSKGYALQMSKSCDSITAAKLLAKARAENSGNLRINQNFSKSIERQIDVYSKTKDEIRKILNFAKVGSIKDRVDLFDNLKDQEPEPIDPEIKAEAIRMEIINARAQARAQSSESVSDTEVELQAPIESKVKPLKIPMKPKISEKSNPGSPGTSLRINNNQDSPKKERRPSVEDLPSLKTKIRAYNSAVEEPSVDETKEDTPKPKPILKSDKERSRSPRKKTPKLLGDHFLNPNHSVQIYAQSATDMSATEDESEMSRKEPTKKLSVVLADQPEPGPMLLQVPPKPTAEARPGIMKSKSFASSSQYEGSIDAASGKKMQMMAFFGHGGEKQTKTVRIKEKQPVRRSSINSITDDIMADDDLVDIDAEFESLLNKTFEKESRRLMTTDQSEAPAGRRGEKAGSQAGGQQRRGRGTVSMDMSSAGVHFQHNLRKSNSFGSSSGSGFVRARDEQPVIEDAAAMYPSPVIRQKNFDPLSSLPSSAGRREAHSPSPTQSEYDTCDPWEDY